MQYYRCKCGEHQSWTTMGVPGCIRCVKCGSDLAQSPELHREPLPHEYVRPDVETDDGPVPGVTVCLRCNRKKSDIEKEEKHEREQPV